MAKRFTDTTKWKRPWFRQLSDRGKLAWIYLVDECDHCGIWITDFEVAEVRLGFRFNEAELQKLLADKVVKIDDDKYFIPSFFEFQYADAKDGFRAKQSAIKALSKLGLINDQGTLTIQSRDTLGLSLDMTSISKSISISNTDPTFDLDALYSKYPRKKGKTKGMAVCRKDIKTQEDFDLLAKAITNYTAEIAREKTDPKYVKHFSTFMNCWRDYVDASSAPKLSPLVREMLEREGA